MARVNNLTNFLNDVATAIKTKLGDNTPIPASQFDTKIGEIETGGNYQTKSISITTNGNYTQLPDTGYDAMSQVSISVNVPSSLPVLQDKTITENGSYTADQNYDGLGTVIVNVAGGTINNQDKTVTQNGTYTADTGYTGLGEITVNVPQNGVKKFNSILAMENSEAEVDDEAVVYNQADGIIGYFKYKSFLNTNLPKISNCTVSGTTITYTPEITDTRLDLVTIASIIGSIIEDNSMQTVDFSNTWSPSVSSVTNMQITKLNKQIYALIASADVILHSPYSSDQDFGRLYFPVNALYHQDFTSNVGLILPMEQKWSPYYVVNNLKLHLYELSLTNTSYQLVREFEMSNWTENSGIAAVNNILQSDLLATVTLSNTGTYTPLLDGARQTLTFDTTGASSTVTDWLPYDKSSYLDTSSGNITEKDVAMNKRGFSKGFEITGTASLVNKDYWVKLFSTEEAMQLDETAVNNDLAIVYEPQRVPFTDNLILPISQMYKTSEVLYAPSTQITPDGIKEGHFFSSGLAIYPKSATSISCDITVTSTLWKLHNYKDAEDIYLQYNSEDGIHWTRDTVLENDVFPYDIGFWSDGKVSSAMNLLIMFSKIDKRMKNLYRYGTQDNLKYQTAITNFREDDGFRADDLYIQILGNTSLMQVLNKIVTENYSNKVVYFTLAIHSNGTIDAYSADYTNSSGTAIRGTVEIQPARYNNNLYMSLNTGNNTSTAYKYQLDLANNTYVKSSLSNLVTIGDKRKLIDTINATDVVTRVTSGTDDWAGDSYFDLKTFNCTSSTSTSSYVFNITHKEETKYWIIGTDDNQQIKY